MCVCGVGELQASDSTDIESDRGAGRERERQKEGMGNKVEGWDRDSDREFDRGLKGQNNEVFK